MTQFVTKEKDELTFYEVGQQLLSQTTVDLAAFFQTAYRSKELGTALYNTGAMPIYKLLEKDLFIKAFAEIAEGSENLGTIPAYLKILYAIFGDTAQITITQEPLHLKIDILAPINVVYEWTTQDGDTIIDDVGDNIVFWEVLARVSNKELLQILKETTNIGTYVEFTLNKEDI